MQPAPAAPPVFKLKVGAKPPPPPPPPAPAEPDPKAEALRALEQPPSEAPLIPLPGVGPGAGAPSVPLGASLPLPVPPSATPSGLAPVAPGEAAPLSRALIHLRAEAPAEALDPTKLPPPLPAHAGKTSAGRNHARRDAMLFGLVLLFVVGAGAAAYFYLTKPDAAKETATSARDKLAEAAQLPGKAVNEARQSLAGAREKEQARVDAVSSGKETPEARAIGNVTPGELQAKLREQNSAFPSSSASTPHPANPATVPAASGQPVTAYAGEKTEPVAPAVPEPVQPSSRLLRYAEGIRVSGVFQGSPARALIDGRLVREGELAESTLGIKFAALDPQAKQLILEEPGGARVRVKY